MFPGDDPNKNAQQRNVDSQRHKSHQPVGEEDSQTTVTSSDANIRMNLPLRFGASGYEGMVSQNPHLTYPTPIGGGFHHVVQPQQQPTFPLVMGYPIQARYPPDIAMMNHYPMPFVQAPYLLPRPSTIPGHLTNFIPTPMHMGQYASTPISGYGLPSLGGGSLGTPLIAMQRQAQQQASDVLSTSDETSDNKASREQEERSLKVHGDSLQSSSPAREANQVKRIKSLKLEKPTRGISSGAEKIETDEVDVKRSRSAGSGSSVTSDTVDDPDQRLGERRLAITFESYGTVGAIPQTIGNRSIYVPDGLSGKFTKYSEDWIFEIRHGTKPVECSDGVKRICIKWTIKNCRSGHEVSACETPKEAMEREKIGRTVCNKVFREAVERRRAEYVELLEEERAKDDPNVCKVSNYESLIKSLSCKRFSQGPLVFGLYHSCVQENFSRPSVTRQHEKTTTSSNPKGASSKFSSSTSLSQEKDE
jgi:hypothetical protein